MKIKGFVYLWKNLVNGKTYIGSHIGDENDGCSQRSLESRIKQSITMTGKSQSQDTINKRVKNNKDNSKGHYITPNGVFTSSIEAAKYNNCSYRTILNKCKTNVNGWYFKPKEDK